MRASVPPSGAAGAGEGGAADASEGVGRRPAAGSVSGTGEGRSATESAGRVVGTVGGGGLGLAGSSRTSDGIVDGGDGVVVAGGASMGADSVEGAVETLGDDGVRAGSRMPLVTPTRIPSATTAPVPMGQNQRRRWGCPAAPGRIAAVSRLSWAMGPTPAGRGGRLARAIRHRLRVPSGSKRRHELGRRAKPFGPVLGEGRRQHGDQVGRQGEGRFLEGRRLLELLQQRGIRGLRLERRLAREDLEDDATERIDVGAGVSGTALHLLRAHVLGCPEDPVARCEPRRFALRSVSRCRSPGSSPRPARPP